ncbi:MAG: substrate-binding domain-containing protein [Blautia sp.]|uniref:sugar ABC transporter substrate-binding protein n=1 Tax=Blautia sp. TaxID=1955243 RepID=UPI002E76084C|nr:substrate-binding domain-containing protein [Blautia sp.]MEE1443561.1 substrate-binding domain-containing protein [Blautia sp.]
MKNSKKVFLLIEVVLGIMVIIMAFFMIRERSGENLERISVIVQKSDDNQWTAFQYGLKMAAEDQGVELFVVGTGDELTVEEQKNLMEQEISKGVDGIILQPILGKDSGKMLEKIEKKVPVMLIEHSVPEKEDSFPIIQPNHYAMGMALGEELLKDYNGNIKGKTFGFTAENMGSLATTERILGFTNALEGRGAEIIWQDSKDLQQQPKVDFVIALDDSSLVSAGEAAAANNLHGSLVYGIGKSTEAVYYLDTGIAVCLVVPDEFHMGYQSLVEMSKKIKRSLYKMKGDTVSYTVLRQDNLFSKENQELLFTMSQ